MTAERRMQLRGECCCAFEVDRRCAACTEWDAASPAGAVDEATILALVPGPFMYHHKMDEQAMRVAESFDRCRELTIQNIKTHFALRAALSSPDGLRKGEAT